MSLRRKVCAAADAGVMMTQPHSSNIVSVSDRIYRALLAAYPSQFRDEYGPHMAQAFRDCCRDAHHQHGTRGVIGLWPPTLGDLAATAVVEHISERSRSMSISTEKHNRRVPSFVVSNWRRLDWLRGIHLIWHGRGGRATTTRIGVNTGLLRRPEIQPGLYAS